MRKVEDELLNVNDKYFKEKTEKFEQLLGNRQMREVLLEIENAELDKIKDEEGDLRVINTLESEKVLRDKIKELPQNKIPIVIAGGSFNKKGRKTEISEDGEKIISDLVKQLDSEKVYFVIGHKMEGYEKAIVDMSEKYKKKFEINAIIPKMVSENVKEKLEDRKITGVRISTESEELGIYKSFNYEIFERRKAIVIAFDGNSPVSNLVLEAKNGKGKSKIYVNQENEILREKVDSLEGYVVPFDLSENVVDRILKENPELK